MKINGLPPKSGVAVAHRVESSLRGRGALFVSLGPRGPVLRSQGFVEFGGIFEGGKPG